MPNVRHGLAFALVCGVAFAACDNDPSAPTENFTFLGCPTGRQSVNAPLTLQFSAPVNPASVTAGNLIVSSAQTGLEVPGTIAIDPTDSTRVSFTPSQSLIFDQTLRVRVQNLQSARTNTQIAVQVCEFTTELPPIREIVWRQLPSASGSNLEGLSLLPNGESQVITVEGALYRRVPGQPFNVIFQSPFFTGGLDVDFLTSTIGFASFRNTRTNQALVLRTVNGAVDFDTLASVVGQAVNVDRLYFEPAATPAGFFGVAGGGTAASAFFLKFSAAAMPTFARQNFTGTGAINDIDFARPDTVSGAAVSRGVRVGTTEFRGQLFTTSNGGTTWIQVAGSEASSQTLTYLGVARLPNGTVFVSGGNGYFARLTPNAGGTTFNAVRVLQNVLVNPDTNDPLALQFTDVQFAPNQSQIGWVIGKQLIGSTSGGTPRFQGFIFGTRDGGNTWTRQGVIDAPNFGAEFPGLNRIEAVSTTLVQIAGDAGSVFEFDVTRLPSSPAGTP